MPPLSFRLIWYGCAKVQAGQLLAGFVFGVELGPLAISADIEGLLRVMKLPQMFIKALLKAAPWLGVGVPTSEDNSAACSAPMTEYWYL